MAAPNIATTGAKSAWEGWLPLAVMPAGTLALYRSVAPWIFMWVLAFAIYLGLKWLSWWKARSKVAHEGWRSVAYLLAWPGMDAEAFLDARKVPAPPRWREWIWAAAKTAFGIVLLWVIARYVPPERPMLRGWIGMLGIVLSLHFGTFEMVALFWRSIGIEAAPIMSAPLRSKSLSEFWGKRWNLGFRQLSYDLVFAPLHRKLGVATAGFLVFVISGLINDLVISVPARGGYGLPTAYFVLQGLGVTIERSEVGREMGLRDGIRGWIFMAVVAATPVYGLFHPAFVLRVIIPFMKAIRAL